MPVPVISIGFKVVLGVVVAVVVGGVCGVVLLGKVVFLSLM